MRKVGKVLAISFGKIENSRIALDKEWHSNNEVTTTVSHSYKIPILIDM
jgi:hypothetical protein